uniref:Uncharacterized protein n=1 Tax=Meleagris gallopavo TaxID=9103 RepID=A0A803XRU6_MELGA
IGKNFCAYLLELRNSSSSFKGIRKALIDTLLDGYENARYGTGVFGKPEYLKYQDALNELANILSFRFPYPLCVWGLAPGHSHVPSCIFVPGAQHSPWARHRGTHLWFSKRESCSPG